MRTKQHISLHLSMFLLVFILSAVVGHADDRTRDRASLRGIKNVVVKVHTFRLNFRQPASLRRNPETTVLAITWQTESAGLRRLTLIRGFRECSERFH